MQNDIAIQYSCYTLKQKYAFARKLLNNPLGVSKSNFLENIKQDCL